MNKSNSKYEKILIKNSDGQIKTAGTINHATKTFTRRVTEKDNLFRKTDSWGLSDELFCMLEKEVLYLQVYDWQQDILYKTTPQVWRMFGKYLSFKPYGKQIFLERSRFTVETEAKVKHMKLKMEANGVI